MRIAMNDIGIWCGSVDEINQAILDLECNYLEKEIGFPMIIRPSFVIGGRGMKIIYNRKELMSALCESQ